jgi:ATP-dependent DNA helicase HFM1/MER3
LLLYLCTCLQAIEWARCTYLYVRMQRSPGSYGVPPQPSAEAFDRWLRDEVVLPTVHELAKHGMVRWTCRGVVCL